MKWLLTIPFLLAGLLFAQSPVVTFFNQAGPAFALNTNGLLAWYRADAEAYAHNDEVTTWTDQQGPYDLGDHLGAGSHPTFKTNQVNGYPAISFDGVNDILLRTDVSPSGTGMTMFVVASIDTASAFGQIANFNGVTIPPDWYFELRMQSSGTNVQVIGFEGSTAASDATGVTNSGFKLFIARRDNTLGTNAIIVHPNPETSVYDPGTGQFDEIAVGGRPNGSASLNLNQRQAEVAVFNYSMNPTAISNAVNYFTNKYNLY